MGLCIVEENIGMWDFVIEKMLDIFFFSCVCLCYCIEVNVEDKDIIILS